MSYVRCLTALGLAFESALALSSPCDAQTIDIVGGSSNPAFTANVAKGNSYDVTTSVNLLTAEFTLNFTGPQTLTYSVHSCPTEFGNYTQVFQSSALVNGSGFGWYSSGAINVPLSAGTHYIIAVSWDGAMTYYYDVGDSQSLSFGSETHGYAVGQNPLPAVFPSSSNDQAIYFQRLTTVAGGTPISNFCTAGTTTHGCVPSISGTGTPSATASSGFTIAVSAVEGQKQGILFYGLNNSGFAPLPWGPSSSFLCVKPPTQRTGAQNSGGTINACNGALSLDWNAFRSSNAGALGNPFSAGQHVFAQGWFRDPPSPKTTMLSDGLDFIVGP